MCWAERCCFSIKADLGCILIGFVSIILSAVMIVTSAVFLCNDHLIIGKKEDTLMGTKEQVLRETLSALCLSVPALKIILYVTLGMGLLMLLTSFLMLVGIYKNKAGLVLWYFGFGIIFTIVCSLGSLLLLIASSWVTSLVLLAFSFLYIHFLVVVHTIYEAMQRGKTFGFAPHEQLDEPDSTLIASI